MQMKFGIALPALAIFATFVVDIKIFVTQEKFNSLPCFKKSKN